MNGIKYELEKNSFIIFTLSMFTSVLSTVFQIIMGRMLPEADFGSLNALLAFSTIVTVPSAIMLFGSAKYTAEYMAKEKPGNAKYISRVLLGFSALIGVVTCALLVIFRGFFASLLNINNPVLIISIGTMILLSGVYSVLIGILQGLKRFAAYSAVPMLSIAIRLVVSVGLLLFGLGLSAIIHSLFISVLIPVVVSFLLLKGYLKQTSERPADYHPSILVSFFGATFFAYLFVNLFLNSDILLIKAFDETTGSAGLYSAGMQISKAIIYVAGAIAAVVFPMTAERAASGIDTRPLLIKAMLLSGGIALVGAVCINIFGDFAVSLIYGSKYAAVVPLLVPMCAFAFSLTILTILLNYSIALGRSRFFSITMAIGGMVLALIVVFFHHTVTQIIISLTVSVGVVCAINIPYALLRKPKLPDVV